MSILPVNIEGFELKQQEKNTVDAKKMLLEIDKLDIFFIFPCSHRYIGDYLCS